MSNFDNPVLIEGSIWEVGSVALTVLKISFLSANFRKRRAPKKKLRTFAHMSHVSALAQCIFLGFAKLTSIQKNSNLKICLWRIVFFCASPI